MPFQQVLEDEGGSEGEAITEEEWRLAAQQAEQRQAEGGGGGDEEDTARETRDPLEQDGLFEGDILIHSHQELFDAFTSTRIAIKDRSNTWAEGVVPYTISSSFGSEGRMAVAGGMLQLHEATCVRFVPRDSAQHPNYVAIVQSTVCASSVGRKGGRQVVRLAPPCLTPGVVAHELMHAIGFWHEQSRADRDQYVEVVWRNIRPGGKVNFALRPSPHPLTHATPYDYGSVMHYKWNQFSKDPSLPTLIPHKTGVTIGQRRGPSQIDILKINLLYECVATATTEITPTTTTTIPPPLLQTTTKPSTTTQLSKGVCQDKWQACKVWATHGECARNLGWMNANCPLSCNFCHDDIAGVCRNNHPHCQYWASKGECRSNPNYMLPTCPQACLICLTDDQAVVSKCKDRSFLCDFWARLGQCQINPRYMLTQCSRACGQC